MWLRACVVFSISLAIPDSGLPSTDLVEVGVDPGDHSIKMKVLDANEEPVPLQVRVKLMGLLKGFMRRYSIKKGKSSWALPIALVRKEGVSLRLCVDYRELNKRIKSDSYPLPALDAAKHGWQEVHFDSCFV